MRDWIVEGRSTPPPRYASWDAATYRIRSATQFLENLAMRYEQTIDPATLQALLYPTA